MIVIFVDFIDQLIDYPINRTSLNICTTSKCTAGVKCSLAAAEGRRSIFVFKVYFLVLRDQRAHFKYIRNSDNRVVLKVTTDTWPLFFSQQ